MPNLANPLREQYEKIEHFIIDDQQPMTTTMMVSNLISKKKQDDDDEESERSSVRKKKLWRKSSEEILEISNQEPIPQVRNVVAFDIFMRINSLADHGG